MGASLATGGEYQVIIIIIIKYSKLALHSYVQ